MAENRDGLRTKFSRWLLPEDMAKLGAKLDANGRSLQFERAHKCLTQSKAIIGLLCESIYTKTVFANATLHEFLAAMLTTLCLTLARTMLGAAQACRKNSSNSCLIRVVYDYRL